MNTYDEVYVLDSVSMTNNIEREREYANSRILESGHVIKVVDKPYPNGNIDEFGNTIHTRTYYFANGEFEVLEPFRYRTKYKLASI